MKKKVDKKKEVDKSKKSKRRCGKQGGMPGCGKDLKADRYFNCLECMIDKDDDVDGVYVYVS